jgi:signal transduction histidine kinase/CheY-like chemotaxis protein
MMQVVPLFYLFSHPDAQLDKWLNYTGVTNEESGFNWLLFGGASSVLLSVVAQIGEQVDILRFLPEKEKCGKRKWWFSMLLGGPGWMLFGAAKLVLGSFLAWLAIQHGLDTSIAADPTHMYQLVFNIVTDNALLALFAAGAFVIISQIKINIANAYAGSLAWSNFFSRLTHSHPGRVVWMVFNVIIALLLMELGVYQFLEKTLQVYSVLVLAWIGSLVADLIINKPLGLSPPGIEFKRSKLFDINPVGVGSMLFASIIGIAAHLDVFNETIKAFASYIAFALPFITVPLIAVLTKGRYYLVPSNPEIPLTQVGEHQCTVCEHTFEHEDMAFCPAYGGYICSLCCSLDVSCQNKCRAEATITAQVQPLVAQVASKETIQRLSTPISQFVTMMAMVSAFMAVIFVIAYSQLPSLSEEYMASFNTGMLKAYVMLLIPLGIVTGLFVLARNSGKSAMEELEAHTLLLTEEINAHQKTSLELEHARKLAETANNAKSRYLAGLSHELRTPLNVLLGYAQLLGNDTSIDKTRREYAHTIERNGQHLADLLEGLLEISKIEAGRLELQRNEVNLTDMLDQLSEMFSMQAAHKKLEFEFQPCSNLPTHILSDKQRLRQILINLLNNAIKYTSSGRVTFRTSYRNQVASFEVIDTGTGLSEQEIKTIYNPFERVQNSQTHTITGTGLGLTISNALASMMGGEISCTSQPGKGSCFTFKLMVSPVNKPTIIPELTAKEIIGYEGERQTILVVDDIEDQRNLVANILTPLGFNVLQADGAESALATIHDQTIDLFLLDITMPEVNGWQLAIQLRKNNVRCPIMMLSANIHELEKSNMLAQFHNDYLSKPISTPLLLAKLSNLLPIRWKYQESVSTPSPPVVEPSKVQIPSKQALLQLRRYAEIGFMSAFREHTEQLVQVKGISEEFFACMQKDLNQCHFENIVIRLDELIDEHY